MTPRCRQFLISVVFALATLGSLRAATLADDTQGAVIITNDNWQDNPSQSAQISASGLAPSNPAESAVATSLLPGNYTAVVAGKNGGTGVGLVEVYNLP